MLCYADAFVQYPARRTTSRRVLAECTRAAADGLLYALPLYCDARFARFVPPEMFRASSNWTLQTCQDPFAHRTV